MDYNMTRMYMETKTILFQTNIYLSLIYIIQNTKNTNMSTFKACTNMYKTCNNMYKTC